jgi:hypothetical protein
MTVERPGLAAEGRSDLPEPSVRSVLAAGLPNLLREGFLPLASFYAAWKWWGLGIGIAVSASVSVLIYVRERRAGRPALLVRIALASVAIEASAGLLSGSVTVYLATGALENGIWAMAFLGSAMVRRPLAGVFACAWYRFPEGFRETTEFKDVFGVVSLAWSVYLLGRTALQIAVLMDGGVGAFVVLSFLTGKPLMLGLLTWSIWYATRALSDG